MSFSHRTWALALGSILCVVTPSPAQPQTGTIRGRVVNAAGMDLPAAEVFVEGTTLRDVTDAMGTFRIFEVPPGVHALTVRASGYAPRVVTVALGADTTLTPDLVITLDPAVDLGEIVVVGRRRAEALRDVPMMITAFSSREIQHIGIERPGDFASSTPNVSLVEVQNAGTSFLTIRGSTQVRNGESPVVVVLDGVPMVSTNQFTQDLFDVEQIEVLKGPQGALYGRNAIGGAMVITTRQPTGQWEGSVRLGAGNGRRRKAQVVVSGPLAGSRLLFSAAGSLLDYDGYIDNVFLDTKVDGLRDRTARAKLKWLPTDTLAIDVRAGLSKTDGGSINFVVTSDLFSGGPDFVGDANDTSVPIESNIRGTNDRLLKGLSVKVDDHRPSGTWTAVLAYDEVREFLGGDQAPYLRTAVGTQTQFLDVGAFSQELRFSSRDDRRFRWILGGYHLHIDRFISTTVGRDTGDGVVLRQTRTLIADPVNPVTSFFADDNANEGVAAFGQGSYDVTRRVEISAALRYDRDARHQTDRGPVSPTRGLERSTSFDKLQPKLTLRYKPTAAATVFATYGEGFRSGGFNQPGVAQIATAAGLVGVRDVFREETARNYEAGFRTEWFADRLRVGGSLFRNDVRGQHYFSFLAGVAAQVLTNIDEVALRGAELEVQAQPVRSLTLSGAMGLTRSEIRRYLVDPTAVGRRAPYIPANTVDLGIDCHPRIADGLQGHLRLDYSRRGPQFWDPNNLTRRDAVGLVNLRVGVDGRKNWSLAAWAKNVGNLKYNAEFVLGGFAHPAQPRTVGLDLTLRVGR